MPRPVPVRRAPLPPGYHYPRAIEVPFGQVDEMLPFPVPMPMAGGLAGAFAFSVAVAITTHLIIRWMERRP